MNKLSFTAFVIILLIGFSCTSEFGSDCDQGNGNIEKRMIELEPLTKVDLGLPGSLFVQEGPQAIEIEAPSDIIDRILNESALGNERWNIELDNCYSGPDIKVWVTLPEFKAIGLSGSGNVSSLDTLRNLTSIILDVEGSGDMSIQLLDATQLDVEIKGSGDMDIISRNVGIHSYSIQGSGDITSEFVDGESCRIEIEGSGNLDLFGKIIDNVIDIEGQGDIKAHGLCSENCTIVTKGSGNCEVKVSTSLNVRIEGSGDICYKGQPIIDTDIEGSGNVKNCN